MQSEGALDELYGDLAYFSRPAIHESDGDIVPVAPWANYIGDPLILPTIDFVDYIAVSWVTPDAQLQTDVYYLKHVVSVLDQMYGVQTVDVPVLHTIVPIPWDAENHVRSIVEQLSKVGK